MAIYSVPFFDNSLRRPNAPYSINWDSPQANGLIAWYPELYPGGAMDMVSGLNSISIISGVPLVGGHVNMGRGVVGTNNDGLTAVTSNATALPLTIMCWIYSTDLTVAQIAMSVYIAATTTNRWSLDLRGDLAGDFVRATTSNAGGTNSSISDAAYPANEPFHLAGVFAGDASRTVYLNGMGGPESTTSRALTGPTDRIRLMMQSTGGTTGLIGGMFEARVYNRALTAAEVHEIWDPTTRWDLYWRPSQRVYFNFTAATAGRTNRLPVLGVA